jgi:hypothetical protein
MAVFAANCLRERVRFESSVMGLMLNQRTPIREAGDQSRLRTSRARSDPGCSIAVYWPAVTWMARTLVLLPS